MTKLSDALRVLKLGLRKEFESHFSLRTSYHGGPAELKISAESPKIHCIGV